MEIKKVFATEFTVNPICDVCDRKIQNNSGRLNASWGIGSQHDGEQYDVQLCETCFFSALVHLRNEKKIYHIFDEHFDFSKLNNFGLTLKDH
ncbi:hypothetical protein EC844_1493 [Acinetobacter calcoaceticus]|uniref:Uncharacterized protein n=1 Tax=Acinetobacter calcoaceticus TaxID=471 RepID=A0A4R1X6V3_ACICA|nr:hypothetical protein EC844_1493 [Acinetobacter calcoaceticus]